MKLYRCFLFAVPLMCYSLNTLGQKLNFDHLNVDNGLSQNTVLSITQDKEGFMWFGTRFGLNKFNSRSFKTYKETDAQGGLSSYSYLRSLLVDKDNKLWIGSTAGLNLYDEKTDRFEQMLSSNNPSSLSDNLINCMVEDKSGRIWVGTAKGLNLLTNRRTKSFRHFFVQQNGVPALEINEISQDDNGGFWIGATDRLLSFKFLGGSIKIESHPNFDRLLNAVPDNSVTALQADHGNIWIGTKKTGLFRLDRRTGRIYNFRHLENDPGSISSNTVRKISFTRDGSMWIGTLTGLNRFNAQHNNFTVYRHDPDDPNSLSQNSVYEIFEDKQGNLWVGTYYGGINVFYPNSTAFHVYRNSRHVNSLSSDIVSAMAGDGQRNLWIGTEGEGLNELNRQTGLFSAFKNNASDPASLSSNLVKAIVTDPEGRVWIGTHQGGLNLLNRQTGKFRRYMHTPGNLNSISSNDISALLLDSRQRFWVGTNKGLNLFDPALNTFHIYEINAEKPAANTIITCLFEDHKGNIWAGASDGLYRLNKNAHRFEITVSAKVNCIYEDGKGQIWLGCYHQGIGLYLPDGKTLKFFTEKDGLSGNNVLGILSDKNGSLWISTDNGLCSYDGRLFKTYNIKDGLSGNEFNYNSFFKDSSGRLFFGSYAGLISFMPGDIKTNAFPPSVVFTDLKLFNKTILPGSDPALPQNMTVTKEITLNYDQNVFSVDFAALNFINPAKNRYAYKLLGFEDDWNHVNVPSAAYTNLSPGKYTLLVNGSNNDGIWNRYPQKLQIRVLPPLWQTWWAYLIYAIITVLIIFVFNRLLIMRALLLKEKDVHRMKLNFFTNISHEIRTPLTLIAGPLEKLMADYRNDAVLSKQFQVVKNNADRLLRLVSELLDFRKAETGNLRLQLTHSNIVPFAHEIYLAYESMALNRGINYTFQTEHASFLVAIDKEQMEKVFFNLLSNAFKFTPDHGCISMNLRKAGDLVEISFNDNGKGIPMASQPGIFSDFFQADNVDGLHLGSGIGLALSKSLMELHQGRIRFESSPAKPGISGNTSFTLSLPLNRASLSGQVIKEEQITGEDPFCYHLDTQIDDLLPEPVYTEEDIDTIATLLVIEDNIEVRNFICGVLEKHYRIIQSADGLEGWVAATTEIPDLIVSDVMMPQMDGFELCRKLKIDDRTSHIPVILLTARAAHLYHITGLETGADAYLTKPFSTNVLGLYVRNLLAARAQMRKKFGRTLTLEPQQIPINTADEVFITKVLRFIENNIKNRDFGVPMLATEIGMSQPVLYKKIRSLTDLSVNDFIKSIRLKKAALLLEQKRLTIYEVAYEVGFHDRKYFSQEFKKYYGKTPSEYVSGHGNSDPNEYTYRI